MCQLDPQEALILQLEQTIFETGCLLVYLDSFNVPLLSFLWQHESHIE